MATLTIDTLLNKTCSYSDNSTLSSRLSLALTRLKVSQSELARRIGIKPQIIQYLCASEANKSKFAFEIAIALEINPTWLIAGKGLMLNATEAVGDTSSQIKVPLLSWGGIDKWINNDVENKSKSTEYILATANTNPASFALRVVDTSMTPRFELGTILIIDPEIKAKVGDFVIVQTVHHEQPFIRQLVSKSKKIYLSPLNSTMYKEIELSDNDKILGVLRQTYYEFVRS